MIGDIEWVSLGNKSELDSVPEFNAKTLDMNGLGYEGDNEEEFENLLQKSKNPAGLESDAIIALDHYQYMHFRKFFQQYSKNYWITMHNMQPAPIGFLLSGPHFDVVQVFKISHNYLL